MNGQWSVLTCPQKLWNIAFTLDDGNNISINNLIRSGYVLSFSSTCQKLWFVCSKKHLCFFNQSCLPLLLIYILDTADQPWRHRNMAFSFQVSVSGSKGLNNFSVNLVTKPHSFDKNISFRIWISSSEEVYYSHIMYKIKEIFFHSCTKSSTWRRAKRRN